MGQLLERKGSLHLRSNHMNYDKRTKVSGWHQNRDTEPKDYDIVEAPMGKKDVWLSAYKRFGSADSKDWSTSTQRHLNQIQLKGDYKVKEIPKKMMKKENIGILDIKRQTGCPERGFGAALPHHSEDHMKVYLDSTYATDYVHPHPGIKSLKVREIPNYSSAYKICRSQFLETADYRRNGRNTWQDESGIYGNREIKSQVFKPTSPITPHL